MNRLDDYLEHMTEAIRLALGYIEGFTKASFETDKRTQQAVLLNLIVIGEAATKISQEYGDFAARNPSIPWKSMKGMRNRAAHGYFDIDLDIVWETVRVALPALADQLTALKGNSSSNTGW